MKTFHSIVQAVLARRAHAPIHKGSASAEVGIILLAGITAANSGIKPPSGIPEACITDDLPF